MGMTDLITNWINGREQPAISGMVFRKVDPTNGKPLWNASRSNVEDVSSFLSHWHEP